MRIKLSIAANLMLAGLLHAGGFQSGNLAVLRAGDGVLDLKLKQSPVFIDEFAPGSLNSGPLTTVAIPTNGPDTLFFNGHAATEGDLARSADRRLLTFAGYGGVNLLQDKGTPSLMDIGRGFCTVDAAGTSHTLIYPSRNSDTKLNPRGGVTDGTNNFWGCGNAFGAIYYNPTVPTGTVVFSGIPNSRAIRLINNVLYTTINGPDGIASDLSAGIYSFQEDTSPVPLPRSIAAKLQLVVPAKTPYTKIAGFDMNPDGTIAYVADTDAGVQKYVKTDGTWKFAYNFAIPQNIPADENHECGCFGLAVDFSGSAPVIYATTTEGYDGCANSNRVVQIVDIGMTAKVTTLAQAPSTRMVYRGVDFTPAGQVAKP
jgi:hypothetical protein